MDPDIVRFGWHTVSRDLPTDPVHIGWYNIPRDMLLSGNVRVGWLNLSPEVADEVFGGTGRPRITSPGSASVTVNTPFSYQIVATNSPTSFGASPLPAGLSVNAAGLISGTPTAIGSTNVALSATNSEGTGTRNLSLRVAAPPPVVLRAYYGSVADWLLPAPPTPAVLDEAYIKALSNSVTNPAVGRVMPVLVAAGQHAPIFAYPLSLPPATQIIQLGFGMNVLPGFQVVTIQIDGVDYRVYYMSAEFPHPSAETYTMTI